MGLAAPVMTVTLVPTAPVAPNLATVESVQLSAEEDASQPMADAETAHLTP